MASFRACQILISLDFNYTVKIRSTRSPGKSGSLCHFTQWKVDKDGNKREYPPVDGEREQDNLDHWYWQFTWKEKDDRGKFVSCTRTVPRRKAGTVRSLIEQNTSIAGILEYLRSSD
jgi:hypothetical protein